MAPPNFQEPRGPSGFINPGSTWVGMYRDIPKDIGMVDGFCHMFRTKFFTITDQYWLIWLVVTGCHQFLAFSHEYWVAIIIPIDELIFFRIYRGVALAHQPAIYRFRKRGVATPLFPSCCPVGSWRLPAVENLASAQTTIVGPIDEQLEPENKPFWVVWLNPSNPDSCQGLRESGGDGFPLINPTVNQVNCASTLP